MQCTDLQPLLTSAEDAASFGCEALSLVFSVSMHGWSAGGLTEYPQLC